MVTHLSWMQWQFDFYLIFRFTINPTTGVITPVSALDYETQNRYDFLVRAIDNGNPQLTGAASVRVNVLDVDDNVPRFVDTIYEGYILENQVTPVTRTGSTSDLAVQVSAESPQSSLQGGAFVQYLFLWGLVLTDVFMWGSSCQCLLARKLVSCSRLRK